MYIRACFVVPLCRVNILKSLPLWTECVAESEVGTLRALRLSGGGIVGGNVVLV